MTLGLVIAIVAFAFVSSITPGPNNMMLLASGANFGVRRTLPHMAGVSVGFGIMVLVVGLGFAGVIMTQPWLFGVLRWVGAAYILYLAFKIATADGLGAKDAAARPMTFLQAAAFQWVNPKAWAIALGAVTTYATKDRLILDVAVITLLISLVNAPCISIWAVFGVAMKRVLRRPSSLRAFNVCMALLLVASLYPLVTEPMGK
jgi:threonine/homoserine/homoserine lactone efflux protein